MQKALIAKIEKRELVEGRPEFGPGDTVRVITKIKEGDRERLQPFEGIVLGRRGGGSRETFLVRRVVQDVGIEKVFPLHAPTVVRIEVVRKGKVRRAKLNYLSPRRRHRKTFVKDFTIKDSKIG